MEYKVRHILVEDEKTANDLLAQIKSNKNKFDDLAKKNSKDPGSAEKGGDLGWAPPTNYVQPFAQAVTQLKKGELVDKPVQTQFGWHIIKVDDTRPVEFPPLDQVRPQLEEMLRQQTLADYQKQLRDKAKIQ
ncbi:putative parvulin-type peptidyl-prolyl cis-trans isomerase precursor [compost metagenome]